MDDILKTLAVIAVFALPLTRQIKENKTGRSTQEPFISIPDTEEAEVLQTPRKHQTFRPQPLPSRAGMKRNKTIPPKMGASPTNDPEFIIHSAEEAREVIIWSEILDREY